MPPSIEPTLHSWSRDDMLDFAYSRGTRLRRQRLAVRSAAAAAALTAVLLPAALMLASADPTAPRRLQTVEAPTTTLPDDALQAEAATSSETGPAGGDGPSSPARPNARGVPTVGGSQPPISPPAKSPATFPTCGSSEVSLHVQPTKASYGLTERVDIDAFITNTSNHVCRRPSVAKIAIYDRDNRQVYTAQNPMSDGSPWMPGEQIQQFFWWGQNCDPQLGCTANFAPRGDYTAEVVWDDRYTSTRVAFSLTA